MGTAKGGNSRKSPIMTTQRHGPSNVVGHVCVYVLMATAKPQLLPLSFWIDEMR